MADIGYRWTLEELGQAMMIPGTALGPDRAAAALRAYEEFMDDIALQGKAEKAMSGIINYPGITAVLASISDRYPSAELLRRHTGPILVVRAGRDRVIPARNTDRLVAALPSTTTVLNLEQADHDSVGAFPAYGDALSAFMR